MERPLLLILGAYMCASKQVFLFKAILTSAEFQRILKDSNNKLLFPL